MRFHIHAPLPAFPCPAYVETPRGRRYCEAGPRGHDGTHCGGRKPEAYTELLATARAAQAATGRLKW